MPGDHPIKRVLAARPSDEETARAAVRPYRHLDAPARFEALAVLLRGMDVLLRGRRPVRAPDDVAFWKHWKDPTFGRPR
ncbi:MAG: hypothetical protein ACC662_08835 [Planctomycetota bacterium]